MTIEEIQHAEKIIEEFPTWTRPMSTDESNLVDRYRSLQIDDTFKTHSYGIPTEE